MMEKPQLSRLQATFQDGVLFFAFFCFEATAEATLPLPFAFYFQATAIPASRDFSFTSTWLEVYYLHVDSVLFFAPGWGILSWFLPRTIWARTLPRLSR